MSEVVVADKLTAEEANRFKVLKGQVAKWWAERLLMGAALLEIRDSRLYRAAYATFEEFCETEYDLKRAQAYRIIEASEVKLQLDSLSPNGRQIKNERQARELGKVEPAKRIEVLTRAAESGNGKVTAKAIKQAAAVVPAAKKPTPAPHPPEPEIRRDRFGHEISAGVLPLWTKAEECAEANIGPLQRVKDTVKGWVERGELFARELTETDVSTLKAAVDCVKRMKPFTICPTCEGINSKACRFCSKRGFISHYQYRNAVNADVRKIWEAGPLDE